MKGITISEIENGFIITHIDEDGKHHLNYAGNKVDALDRVERLLDPDYLKNNLENKEETTDGQAADPEKPE